MQIILSYFIVYIYNLFLVFAFWHGFCKQIIAPAVEVQHPPYGDVKTYKEGGSYERSESVSTPLNPEGPGRF